MSSADVYSVNNKNNIEHCNMCPILASCAYHNSPNTVFTRERIQIQVCYSMKTDATREPDTEEISKCIVEEDIHTHVPCVLNLEEGETFHAEAINLQESAVPLELYLGRVHDDFSITDSELNNIEDMHFDGVKMKKHAKRMGQIADDWDEHWDQVFDAHTESFVTIPSICWNCKIFLTAAYIRCLCCVRTFCPHCDIQFHSWNVFHQREVLGNSKLVKLRSRDFWDEQLSVVVQKDVAVPCFIPAHCQSCRSINTLTLEPLKNKYMIVVTLL
ncbi:Uncharacterized protein APZ42_026092, partial [Daphnia magna]